MRLCQYALTKAHICPDGIYVLLSIIDAFDCCNFLNSGMLCWHLPPSILVYLVVRSNAIVSSFKYVQK